MKAPAPTCSDPDRMGRILLLAMEEILGRTGVDAILTRAGLSGYGGRDLPFPADQISRIGEALEAAYGPRGGRGLALQTGRACFKYGLREFGPGLGLTELAFRLLPLPAKLKKGSEALAGLFNNFAGQRVRLAWNEGKTTWRIERCPLCAGRHTDAPCCHLAVGLLQEALYWASGGKVYMVEETSCIARGDSACTIIIDQEPMS